MIASEINQSVQMMLPFTRDGVSINTASIVINEGRGYRERHGHRPAAVRGTINFMVGGPFNVEPASEMSDISDGPQDAVKFNVAAIPSIEPEGSGQAFLRPGNYQPLQRFSGSRVCPQRTSPSLPLSLPGMTHSRRRSGTAVATLSATDNGYSRSSLRWRFSAASISGAFSRRSCTAPAPGS